MALFSKDNLKTHWTFKQKGIIWKFFFAGENIIAGETRDTKEKTAYIFSIDIGTGKTILKNFLFENGNFWNAITNSDSERIYFTRLDKSGLPVSKGLFALNVLNGNLLWEIPDVDYFFCSGNKLYCTKQNFESTDIYEYNNVDGCLIRKVLFEERNEVFMERDKADLDFYNEEFDYPVKYNKDSPTPTAFEIIESEIKDKKLNSPPEFIEKENYVLFNYYINKEVNLKNITANSYQNIFCIYNKPNNKLVYKSILIEETSYEVPDSFFVKKDFVFFLREKNELISIKL